MVGRRRASRGRMTGSRQPPPLPPLPTNVTAEPVSSAARPQRGAAESLTVESTGVTPVTAAAGPHKATGARRGAIGWVADLPASAALFACGVIRIPCQPNIPQPSLVKLPRGLSLIDAHMETPLLRAGLATTTKKVQLIVSSRRQVVPVCCK